MTIQGKIRKEHIQILNKLDHFITRSPEDIHSSTLRGLAEVISEPLVIIFSEKLWKTEEIPKTGRPGNCWPVILTSVLGKSQELFIREKKKLLKDQKEVNSIQGGLVKSILCQNKLIYFHDRVASLVDRRETADVIHHCLRLYTVSDDMLTRTEKT